MNIYINELKKFNKLSNYWWDHNAKIYNALHILNIIRLKFISSNIILKNKKILDIGCGGGILTESLSKKGAKVTGIDICEKAIIIAKKHAKLSNLNIKYKKKSIENYKKNYRNKYDIITCMEIIEHIPNINSLIKKCNYLLKNNGHIFLSSINKTTIAMIKTILIGEYIFKIIPINTHSYHKYIKIKFLLKKLKKNSLKIKNIKGIKYNHLSKKTKVTTDTSINYILHIIKSSPRGFEPLFPP